MNAKLEAQDEERSVEEGFFLALKTCTCVGKRTFVTVQYFSCAYSAKNNVPFAESVVSCSSEFSTPPFAKIIGIP